MIRPLVLQEYLNNVIQDFPEFEGIFLTLTEGTDIVVASTNNKDQLFYCAMASLWEDCSVVAKLKLYGEESQFPLEQCILEHDLGNVIICGLHDTFVLGFLVQKDKGQLSYALEKVDLIKTAVEKQLGETILVQEKSTDQNQME